MPIAVYAFLAAINLAAFLAFGADKRRAERKKWRIPEKTLLLLAFFGGSAGALAGMKFFHHKTKKPRFAVGLPCIFLCHAAMWLLLKAGIFK